MNHDDLSFLPASRVVEAIRARELSPVELTRHALERIDRLNPAYNAYLTVLHDEALATAQAAEDAVARGDELGPLHGLPVSVKDLLYMKGVRATGGSLIHKDFVPDRDAPVVRKLRDAGAVILGKTNTPEFGMIATTENRLGPPCRNPWDTERTSGGSSGGAGVAAATGMGYLHVGTDGGGSVRIPASFCGVFGLKPSTGRVPAYNDAWGGFGAWPSLSQAGPMTRTVDDAALMLDVIAGPEPDDPFAIPARDGSYRPKERDKLGLRVAWTPDLGWATVDPEVRALCEAAARRFADFGCEVEEAAPKIEDSAIAGSFLPIAAASDAASWAYLLDERPDDLSDYGRDFLSLGRAITGIQYVQAETGRAKVWHIFDEFLSRYDLLLMPVLVTPPFPIGKPPTNIDGKEVRPFAWTPFTMICNLTGQPAASVPAGWTKAGLPVGLHVIARGFREQTVIDACAAFERAQPWQDRRPPEPATAGK
ncbi:MAG: amidase [Dehalococcoidia bacterium]